MLSLTDDQLATVFNAAAPLLPGRRSRFLADVAAAINRVPASTLIFPPLRRRGRSTRVASRALPREISGACARQ